MADVAITAGTGTNIHTFATAAPDHDQYVREAPATAAVAPATWTLSASASTSVLAAAESRRWVCLINNSSSVWVYIRFDGTAPTTAIGGYHFALAPGGTYVVEKEMVTLAVSLIASGTDASHPLSVSTASAA